MAKKYSGGIVLATGLKVENPSPLDDRLVVENLSDLTDPDILPNVYGGIVVAVVNSNYQLYKWNGNNRTSLSNWVVLSQDNTITENQSFSGKVVITGSLTISSSSDISGDLTVSNTLFTDVLSASIAHFSGDGVNDILIISTGGSSPITVNPEGLIIFDEFTYTPTPVEGGLLYSGSNFYLGFTSP